MWQGQRVWPQSRHAILISVEELGMEGEGSDTEEMYSQSGPQLARALVLYLEAHLSAFCDSYSPSLFPLPLPLFLCVFLSFLLGKCFTTELYPIPIKLP